MADHSDEASCIELTANIVSAYVSNNTVSSAEIPALISQVYSALMRVSHGGAAAAPAEPVKPAVSIKHSITPEHLVCLEDGRKFKSLKRHLRSQYQMMPDQYRAKWNLPADYPMVAPKYAAVRSRLAKQMGLGQQRRPPRIELTSAARMRVAVGPSCWKVVDTEARPGATLVGARRRSVSGHNLRIGIQCQRPSIPL
jgi:predicted transcriptional regulator